MPLRITLTDSEALEINVDLGEWNRAFQRALQSDSMIEVEGAGHTEAMQGAARDRAIEALAAWTR